MQEEAKSLHCLPHGIFIYGTLKRGQPNHHALQEFGNHQFFGTGCTEQKYPLIIDTVSNLPFLVDAPGKGQVHSILFTIALVCIGSVIIVLAFAVYCRRGQIHK